jgi:hypothetical protein
LASVLLYKVLTLYYNLPLTVLLPAIFSRYELTAAAYREKFRNSSQLSDESFKEFAVRLVGFRRH